MRPFHIMTKPIGPICNLDCMYCFYLEKERLFPGDEQFRMSDEVLESYIRQYIESQDTPEVSFAWQGGEPTLLGVEFFERVVELQQQYANGKQIHNAIQTNGTLLDDAWCVFLTEHRFLVGLSIDGPRKLHDTYRVDKRQRPTFDQVMRGLGYLQKHQTEYNTLTVVNRANGDHPLEVYRFLKEMGSTFLQFIPLVERNPTHEAKSMGYDLNLPPEVARADATTPVTTWSVGAEQYGTFLVQIFDEWVRHDVGRTYVQIVDVTLENWMKLGSSLCVFSETCGRALAIEHSGEVYSCDHYVYPQYALGNLMNTTIGALVESEPQRTFGTNKRDALPRFCRECDVRHLCNGECPKHRFTKTPDGEEGLNYLCPSYKHFFHHVGPYMQVMAQLLNQRRAPAGVMQWVREQDRKTQFESAGRNDPCPCGSGRKFRHCCGGNRRPASAFT